MANQLGATQHKRNIPRTMLKYGCFIVSWLFPGIWDRHPQFVCFSCKKQKTLELTLANVGTSGTQTICDLDFDRKTSYKNREHP